MRIAIESRQIKAFKMPFSQVLVANEDYFDYVQIKFLNQWREINTEYMINMEYIISPMFTDNFYFRSNKCV